MLSLISNGLPDLSRVKTGIDPDGATDEEDEAGSDHRNNVDSDTANPNKEAVEEATVEEIVTRKLTREIQQEVREDEDVAGLQ